MFECSVRLADFNIFLRTMYDFTPRFCAAYQTETPISAAEADLVVEVSPADVEAEVRVSPPGMDAGYIESICVYRAICRRLPPLGGMLLHAAVIADGERGYAFTADSGTGKTTHIRLWQSAFGDRIRIINGDKPLLRRHEGKWYAYGTPWCGKEGWHIHTSVPLEGICFLRRGVENTIRPYPVSEAITAIFSQLALPEDPVGMAATLDLLDALIRDVPFYELHCTISEEAARVARAGMGGR